MKVILIKLHDDPELTRASKFSMIPSTRIETCGDSFEALQYTVLVLVDSPLDTPDTEPGCLSLFLTH